MALSLFCKSANTVSLQGIGTPAAAETYRGWGADQQAKLESYIGSSLPLQFGTGFGALVVVPEPGTYGLIARVGLAASAACHGRRQTGLV